MSAPNIVIGETGLLLVDPYNDFLSDNGKLQSRAKPVMDEVGTIAHMRAAVTACRAAGITVFYVPHNRAKPSDFSQWAYPTPYQLGCHRIRLFAEGTWGGVAPGLPAAIRRRDDQGTPRLQRLRQRRP